MIRALAKIEESIRCRICLGVTRRRFLQRTIQAGTVLAIGCGTARGDGTDTGDSLACEDALAGGERVRILRFDDEYLVRYEERHHQELTRLLRADLAALTLDELFMS